MRSEQFTRLFMLRFPELFRQRRTCEHWGTAPADLLPTFRGGSGYCCRECAFLGLWGSGGGIDVHPSSVHSRLLCSGLDELQLMVGRDRDCSPCCASRRPGSVDQCRTLPSGWLASNCLEQTVRWRSPVGRGVEESTSTPTGAGAGTWLWLCSAVLRTWSPSSSTANPSSHSSDPFPLAEG